MKKKRYKYYRFEQLERYDALKDKYQDLFKAYVEATPLQALVLETDLILHKEKMKKAYNNINK